MGSARLKPGWTRVAFGEMATCVNDRVDNPADAAVDRYVGLEHLDSDSLVIRRWGNPTDVSATKLLFRKGDIIFGRRRVYQRKLAVADFDGICSAHAMVLRAKPAVVMPQFLPFFMQSDLFMDRAKAISVGSISPTINWTTLAKEEFALPPSGDQRRLAAMFAETVRVLNRYGTAVDAGTIILKSLIKMFDDSISDVGTLGDVVDRIESGQSPGGIAKSAARSEFGVLKVSAVGDWQFFGDENKRISADEFDDSLEVKDGDFLAARANANPDAVGRTCLVQNCRSGLMLSDKTWRLIFKSGAVGGDPIGALAWTKSARFRQYLKSRLNGTDAKNISKVRFLSAPFPGRTTDLSNFSVSIRRVLGSREALYKQKARGLVVYKALIGDLLH